MLDRLRARAVETGRTNLQYVQSGLLSYVHEGLPVAGIYTRKVLHHMPDFWKALALDRIVRLLQPGGVLRLHDMIYEFQPADAAAVFDRWLSSAAHDPATGYTRDDFITHIRTEHSTFRWLIEPMRASAGLTVVTVDLDRPVYGTYACVKAR
jgi:hypothetical protein